MQKVDFGWAQPKKKKEEPLVKAGSFDRELARQQFEVYSLEVDKMVKQAGEHEVTDNVSNEAATAMVTQVKRLRKKIEDTEKEFIVEPEHVTKWKDFVGAIKSFAAPYKTRLKEIQSTLKDKQDIYINAVELKRREAERKAQEAQRELQKKLDKEADKRGLERVELPTPVMGKPESVTRTETGISYQVTTWHFKIEDLSLIPREHLLPGGELCNHQTASINGAINRGIREIPGLTIFSKKETRYKT